MQINLLEAERFTPYITEKIRISSENKGLKSSILAQPLYLYWYLFTLSRRKIVK